MLQVNNLKDVWIVKETRYGIENGVEMVINNEIQADQGKKTSNEGIVEK